MSSIPSSQRWGLCDANGCKMKHQRVNCSPQDKPYIPVDLTAASLVHTMWVQSRRDLWIYLFFPVPHLVFDFWPLKIFHAPIKPCLRFEWKWRTVASETISIYYIHMYTCIYICMCVWVCLCVCVFACLFAFMKVHSVYLCVCLWCVWMCKCAGMYC